MKMLSELLETSTFPRFKTFLENESSSVASGVYSQPLAALAAHAFHQLSKKKKSVVLIVQSPKEVEIVLGDLKQWLPDEQVHYFPSLNLEPYEWRLPFGHIIEQRLSSFHYFLGGNHGVWVTSLTGFLQKLPDPRLIKREIITLSKGQEISFEDLKESLIHLGFSEEAMVEDMGQYSIRGGIMDIYPYLMDNPVRIELWGDEIESIREFDIFSQRSKTETQSIDILPIDECCLSPGEIEEGLLNLGDSFDSSLIEEEISRLLELNQRTGLAWQLPFFTPNESSLLDYIEGDPCIILSDKNSLGAHLEKSFTTFQQHYQSALEKGFIVAPPEKILFSLQELEKLFQTHTTYQTLRKPVEGPGHFLFDIEEQTNGGGNLNSIQSVLDDLQQKDYQVYILSPNQGQAERLKSLCKELPVTDVLIGQISKGFISHQDKVALFTDHQIFNRYNRSNFSRKHRGGVSIPDFDALTRNDVVVHQDYGIGQYLGIKRIQIQNYSVDCILLLYKDNSKLTIPVTDLKKLLKYSAKEEVSPILSKLGGKTWEQLKTKTKKSIIKLAKDLIELYAKRSAIKGYSFSKDSHFQLEFEDAFLYVPTPDQTKAIGEVKKDMEDPKPMDRLICGDVGFGKTEVAMRAAFKCVLDKKQVAVLAPTTVLVSQHFSSFQERFGNWPVQIEYINRFRTAKEEKDVLQRLKEGQIDILIGTHRLISKEVVFKDLGLIVVDEEQKFGVKQKDKLKQARAEVDVLSMSATPIPRSLHMSLVGARNFSLIQTPPRNRLPIETRVVTFKKDLIRESLEKELERGGQAFFVHNRVRDILEVALEIEKLIPQARVGVAHGQMNEKDLERIMLGFIRREYDVLICTSIIESGIDIPNVNTIIINKAQYFGLSQLFQMRGRVGRSAQQAYCLLVAPKKEKFTDEAKKRLYALEKFTELGSGYKLAMRDLEIRGAGNILGVEQSGHITSVGFDTYCALLKEAVRELQGRQEIPIPEPEIEFAKDAFIPETYVQDGLQRISLYQKIARYSQLEEVDDIEAEIKDRFGPLVASVTTLLQKTRAQIFARSLGFQKVILKKHKLTLEFSEIGQPQAKELALMLSGINQPFHCLNQTPLKVEVTLNGQTIADQILQTLEQLALLSQAMGSLKEKGTPSEE